MRPMTFRKLQPPRPRHSLLRRRVDPAGGSDSAGRRHTAAAPEYGPAKGTLVIVGGGSTDGTAIMEKFVELGGGVNGKFVIVPTAGGNRERRTAR